MRPGELLAIMGASGAGKSTMLNALTFRNLSGLDVQGEIKANGVPITPTMVTSLSAYIQQDDMFIGILTVREQLEFQAKLRDGWWFAHFAHTEQHFVPRSQKARFIYYSRNQLL